MATYSVETRTVSPSQTFQIEGLPAGFAFGKKQLAHEPRLTRSHAEDHWAVRVWSSCFPWARLCAVKLLPVEIISSHSTTSTTAGQTPSSVRIELQEAETATAQQSFIKMVERLSSVRQPVGQEAAAEAAQEESAAEETRDWDAVVEPPSNHQIRRVTFHLVRRGYKEPRIIAESDD